MTETRKPVLIDRAQAGLGVFAASDAGRYSLNFVHVSGSFTEASNGHVLARLNHDGLTSDDFPVVDGQATAGADLLIDPDALAKAAKSMPKRSHLPILETIHAGVNPAGETVLTTTDLDSPSITKVKSAEVAFPETDRVIPKDIPPTIAFSARYLGQIAKWAQAHGKLGKDTPIRFHVKDKDSAARLQVELEDLRDALFVLMPVRVEGK